VRRDVRDLNVRNGLPTPRGSLTHEFG
jgi:hypothetical protein